MAGVKKQDDKESSRNQLRAEAEKKVARSADKSAPLKKQVLDKLVHELQVHQVELEMQNEELRGAQEQIAKSRNDYADLYDFSPVGYLTFNGDALITGVNLTGAALLGLERQKLLKRRFRQFVAPADAGLWDRHFVSVLQQGEKQSCDLLLKRKDGSTLYARLDSIRVETDSGTSLVRTAMSDITVQRKAEEELRVSENTHRLLFDNSPEYTYAISPEGIILNVNNAALEALGYEKTDLVGKPLMTIYAPESLPIAKGLLEKWQKTGILSNEEIVILGKNGTRRTVLLSAGAVRDENGEILHSISVQRDVTVRKLVEEALRTSEALLKATGNMAKVGGWELDLSTNQVTWTEEVGRIHEVEPGYQPKLEEALNFYAPESRPDVEAALKKAAETGEPYDLESLFIPRGSKDKIWVRSLGKAVYSGGKVVKLTGTFQNIDKYKRAEEAFLTERQRLHNVLEVMPMMVCLLTVDYHVAFANRAFREKFGESHGKHCYEYCFGKKEPCDFCESYTVLRTGKPHRWEVTAPDGATYIEAYDFPFTDVDGSPMILEVDVDITERKLSEEKLAKSYESVKKTLNDAINTMVKIVELRDPYTAGHQQKVADLATAIAGEMKLEDTRIDQLRTAALIHDIGKMYIPSDILSKPGKLADMEFSLIKTHAQGGYDIVKSMDFPGVVAKTVLQHHERLDGSGYPNQLKSEDTLLEAKILSVADVVEAMASHRPYRPALGIDKALEEISKNRGRLYDPGVVDTCLALFTEKNYKFKE